MSQMKNHKKPHIFIIEEEGTSFRWLKSQLPLFILDPVVEAVDQGWVIFPVSCSYLPFFTMQNRKQWFWNLLANTNLLLILVFMQEIKEY